MAKEAKHRKRGARVIPPRREKIRKRGAIAERAVREFLPTRTAEKIYADRRRQVERRKRMLSAAIWQEAILNARKGQTKGLLILLRSQFAAVPPSGVRFFCELVSGASRGENVIARRRGNKARIDIVDIPNIKKLIQVARGRSRRKGVEMIEFLANYFHVTSNTIRDVAAGKKKRYSDKSTSKAE